MASRPVLTLRRTLIIGMLLAVCVSAVLLSYYIINILKHILQFPNQLYFCEIGFELTPLYATSAFSCKYGTEPTTIGPVILVEGDEAYKRTMLNLSADPDYRVGGDEIENISAIFSKLATASMERTRSYIHSATLGYPDLPALVTNSIEHDIMRKAFAGIKTSWNIAYEQILHSPKGNDSDIHAAHSILAGHGRGLCQPWQAEKNCNCVKDQKLPSFLHERLYGLA